MKVLDVLSESLDILMYSIRSYTSYLDQTIVLGQGNLATNSEQAPQYLDKDGVTGQVAMDDGRGAAVEIGEGREDLGTPSLPGLERYLARVFLGLFQEWKDISSSEFCLLVCRQRVTCLPGCFDLL